MEENRDKISEWSVPCGKRKKKIVSAAAICACLILVGVFIFAEVGRKSPNPKEKTSDEKVGGIAAINPDLAQLEANKIYPKVAVNGELYWWYIGRPTDVLPDWVEWGRRGLEVGLKSLPMESVYYGEIKHVPGNKPTDDCEFVSVFPVSGQIYVIPDDPTYCCLYMSTTWFKKKIILFKNENRYNRTGDFYD